MSVSYWIFQLTFLGFFPIDGFAGPTFLIVSPVVISPYVLASGIFTGPAMEIAMQEVNQIYGDHFNLSLHFLTSPRTSDCFSMLFNAQDEFSEFMFRTRKNKTGEEVAAILAPGCLESYEQAQIGRYFDLLVLLSVATDVRTLDKDKFGNVIMTSSLILDYYMAAVVKLLERYDWTTVYLVHDSNGTAYAAAISLMEGLVKVMKTENKVTFHTRGVSSTSTWIYGPVLSDIKNHSRVVIFIGHALNLRKFMISASNQNMTGGDYVFVGVSPFEYPHPDFGNFTWQNYDENDKVALRAYQTLFVVKPASTTTNSSRRNSLFQQMIDRTKRQYNYTYSRRLNITEMPSPFTISSYAAVYLIAAVLNESLPLRASTRDFAGLASHIYNRCFPTPLGEFCFDKNGQRQIELEISQFNSTTGLDPTVFTLDKYSRNLLDAMPIQWLPGMIWPVPNIPLCGYYEEDGPCRNQGVRYVLTWSVTLAAVLIVVTVCIFFLVRRHITKAAKLRKRRWEIDINLIQKVPELGGAVIFNQSRRSTTTRLIGMAVRRTLGTMTTIANGKAIFKDRCVWIKKYQIIRDNTDPKNKKCLRTLSQLYELRHTNLVSFVGIVPPEGNTTLLVNEWCSRGNVREMLDGVRYQVDWNIRSSLIGDLVKGVEFIHNSTLKQHGNLSHTVCLIDNQMTLKIAELGYLGILTLGYGPLAVKPIWNAEYGRNRLYMSEDVLTQDKYLPTPESDIYAVGKLMIGIATDFSLAKPEMTSNAGSWPETLGSAIDLCVQTDPKARPTVTYLARRLFRSGSKLMDKILRKMEMYSQELEEAVRLRTVELEAEQRKCDMLLLEMIPVEIVHKLRHGTLVEPELFNEATLSFSSLVGFVDYATTSSPLDVVALLNDSHGLFDQVIMGHDVYKVETIGDSYFLASGLPIRNEKRHANELCKCALEICSAFTPRFSSSSLRVRVGIHSGPCVAAVVGLKRPRYCLYGDTVNTASRMESHGEPSKIHLSQATAVLVQDETDRFKICSRGILQVKGKGALETFWYFESSDCFQF